MLVSPFSSYFRVQIADDVGNNESNKVKVMEIDYGVYADDVPVKELYPLRDKYLKWSRLSMLGKYHNGKQIICQSI